jgi:hypothetical protein
VIACERRFAVNHRREPCRVRRGEDLAHRVRRVVRSFMGRVPRR